ncbi:MAG TPA: Holliday junction branch migration protein RuvA [Methanocella sp.]|nr:Holliday junction branch migration protein RuvA [Methanocella sp.]
MIAHIEGRIDSKTEETVVIDVAGVGYEVYVPEPVVERLPQEGELCKLYIHANFREEDGTSLYGFSNVQDRDFFRLLLTVSGIGPKVGLGIMSGATVEEIAEAIVTEDLKLLTQMNGVGKKTAQRLVLELKDKVAKLRIMHRAKKQIQGDTSSADAVDALVALGYSRQVASDAVAKARETFAVPPVVNELVVASLRFAAK